MSSSSEEVSWINWFCGLRGHEFLCHVPEEYIQQSFNLTGLPEVVPHYKQSLETILDMEEEEENEQSEEIEMEIEQSAEMLYGLIHARLVTLSPATLWQGRNNAGYCYILKGPRNRKYFLIQVQATKITTL